jgi:tripartite-type tricarboxylate transporter receptor subunit TctC
MKKVFLLRLFLVLIAISMIIMNCSAAEKFPDHNLTIIVPFAPGGAVDITCRIISKIAPDYLNGKKIIVENKAGGGAVIGQTYVSKAKPDGYTMLAYTSSVVNNPLTKETTYTYKSFQPIGMYCFDPEVLLVPADSPFKNLKEFITYAKNNVIIMNTPGFSTSHHIAAAILSNLTGAKFKYLHVESGAIQTQQLLGGHVDCGMMSFGEALGQLQAGSIRALATMANEKRTDFPDVPTFKEEGIDLEFGPWRGLAVPIDTPKDIVEILDKAIKGIVEDQRFIDDMTKAGYPINYLNSKEFAVYVDKEADYAEKILPIIQSQK